MRPVLLLFFLFYGLSGRATNYYVSATGNDVSSGTSPMSAWRSVARVNQAMTANLFNPGDSLLFKRGDTFNGQISLNLQTDGTAMARFVMGAYGTGAKPLLKGTLRVQGWVAETVNGLPMFTRAGWSQPLRHMYLNDRQLLIARLPNSGYLTMTADGNQNTPSVVAAEFGQNPAWAGATIHVRAGNDAIDTRVVQNIGGSTATLSAGGLTFQPKAGWGYIMENKLAFLDQRGEWFFDEVGQKLYVYPPAGIDLTQPTMLAEGSVADYGIELYGSSDYVTIRDIDFRYQCKAGIFNYDLDNGQILNCTFSGQGEHGINIEGAGGARNCLIDGNTFRDQNNSAFRIKCTNCVITNNDSRRNFLVPGYAKTGLIDGLAMAVSGQANRIRHNRIDSSGYHGLSTLSLRDTIEFNVISNCGLTKNDVGGIYSWGNFSIQNPDTLIASNAYIRRNLIYNVGGTLAGTPAGNETLSHGIYLDDACWRYRVTENTVYNGASSGIFIQSCRNIRIDNNLCYNNSGTQFQINTKRVSDAPLTVGTIMTDNTAISTRNEDYSLVLFSAEPGYEPIGQLDRNRWYNPYSDYVVKLHTTTLNQLYALFQWRAAKRQDLASRPAWYRSLGWENIAFQMPNLKSNPTFDANLNGWVTALWTNSAGQWLSGAPFNGGYGRINRTDPANEFLVEGRDLPSLTTNTLYHISFSALASQDFQNLTTWGRKQECCYDFYNDFTRQFPVRTTRGEFATIVNNTQSFAGPAMLQFMMPKAVSSFSLDNVSVRRITATPEIGTQKAILFTNPTKAPITIQLAGATNWFTVDSVRVTTGSLTLSPFSGRVLYRMVPGNVYSIKAGNWNDPTTWSCGCLPTAADMVGVYHAVVMPAGYVGKAQKITYAAGGAIQMGATARLMLAE